MNKNDALSRPEKKAEGGFDRPQIVTVSASTLVESLGPATAVYGSTTGGGGIIP